MLSPAWTTALWLAASSCHGTAPESAQSTLKVPHPCGNRDMNARTQDGTSRGSSMESSSAAAEVSARIARGAGISVPSSSWTAHARLPRTMMATRAPRRTEPLRSASRAVIASTNRCAPPAGTAKPPVVAVNAST